VKKSEQLLEEIRTLFRKKESDFLLLTQLILKENISAYPIFIATQTPIPIGKPFLISEEEEWKIYVTILEDLVRKKIIRPDRIEAFKQQHENALSKAAILLLANPLPPIFLFLPFTAKANPME